MNLDRIILNSLEFIYCLLDVMLLQYCCALFLQRKETLKFRILIQATVVVLIFFITVNYSTLSTLLSFTLMLVYGLIVFRGSAILRISIVSLYFVGVGIVSLLLTSLVPVVTSFKSQDIMSNPVLKGTLMIVSRIIIFGIVYVLSMKSRKSISDSLKPRYLVFFFVVITTGLLLLFEFVYVQNNLSIETLIASISLIFIAGILLITFLVFKYFKAKETNNLMSMRLYEADMKNEKYIQSMSEQLEIMRVKHDLKNHLIVLEALVNQNKPQEAEDYIHSLLKHPGIKTHVNTCNNTVNAILNQKITEYPAIKFNIRHDNGLYDVPRDKLTIILGNAIDNAIEASSKYDCDEKEIRITLSENDQFIKIFMANPFAEMPVEEHGVLISSKNTKFSGLGMTNITRAAESLNGQVRYTSEKGIFELTVLIEKCDLGNEMTV